MARRFRRRNNQRNEPKIQFRINEYIRVPEVRLVGDNLAELSEKVGKEIKPEVYPTHLARKWADMMELDLVEISPNAAPPVVKLVDYNKFLYEKKKKAKELKAKAVKTVVKEIRFGPNTDDHDYEFKLRHAKDFLENGMKVKAFVQFRGRSIVHKDRGELLLLNFIKDLEELGSIEVMPKMEGRRMNVIISPRKKKG